MWGRRPRQPAIAERYRREALELRARAAQDRDLARASSARSDEALLAHVRVTQDDSRVAQVAGDLSRIRTENGFTGKLRVLFEGGHHAPG